MAIFIRTLCGATVTFYVQSSDTFGDVKRMYEVSHWLWCLGSLRLVQARCVFL